MPPSTPSPAAGDAPAPLRRPGPPGGRRAGVVWGVALVAYVVAVLHRTSFGVAGLDAAHRFGVSAGVLAGFTVLQLVMYAGLQIPVGVALDRYGSRRLVVAGALLMATGQVILALTTSVGAAYAGRAMVGAGDAATFIPVLRLVPAWFPARRVPLLTQLTGLIGQLGQVLSAVPLVALLHGPGWTAAFGSAAAAGLLAAAAVAIAVRDRPGPDPAPPAAAGPGRMLADLRSAWRHPGTRLGLWTHFTTQFPGTVFVLAWGYPFLLAGEGVRAGTASALLTLFVAVGVATGPVLGVLVQRHPLRRSWLVLAVVAANCAAWTAVLAWPGRAPSWLLVLLVVALASGGPGSMIGFDFARTFNPPNRLGTATGIVNVGGFVASLVTIQGVGLVLDARGAGDAYRLSDFRVALAIQYVIWLVGLVGIVRARRKVRRRLAAGGIVVPPLRVALARYRSRTPSGR